MKTLYLKDKRLFVIMTIGFVFCFLLGWLFAFNFGGLYETGYKMAYLEMKQLLKEGVRSKSDFYIKGLDDFKFYPRGNDTIGISKDEKS